MIKILAIGNSFSSDATRWLWKIANSAGIENHIVNLYIGGCSLEQHSNNIKNNNAFYSYELNGESTGKMVTIDDTLAEDDWDIITIQQVSQNAGVPESYYPYITEVLSKIREIRPMSKIWFHETWAYEIDSTHGGFARFGNNQTVMYNAIKSTVYKIADDNGLSVIPCGDFIQELRTLKEFNYAEGGISLCRDAFHMSLDYGRFALGVMWYKHLMNGDPEKISFAPDGTDAKLIDIIKKAAK